MPNTESMRMLHLSALPLWSMGEKAGMPSLYETIQGYVERAAKIDLILLHANIYTLSQTANDSPWETVNVHVVYIPGLELGVWSRRLIQRICPWETLQWIVDWFINLVVWTVVTVAYVAKGMQLCRRRSYDIVYAHNEFAALSGYLLGKLIRRPNITRLYGTFLWGLMRLPFVSLRYPVAVSGFRIPSGLLIVGNDGTRGDRVAERLGVSRERLRFWQNGVPHLSANCQKSDKTRVARDFCGLEASYRWLVMASRLADWKRIDRAIAAMPDVLQELPRTQLVLIGDGSERQSLERLSREYHLGNHVAFLGSLPRPDVFTIMSVSDALVMTNDFTNRCNAIFEAIRCGLPIVTLEDGSTEGLLKNEVNSLKVLPDDIEELSKAMIMVLRDDELIERLHQGARRTSSILWTWKERMRVEVQEVTSLCQMN